MTRLAPVLGALSRHLPQPGARRRLRASTRLHLGCGDHKIPGWTNIDLVRSRGVVARDLTKPMPIDPGSIDYIFTEHFIEHITYEEACRVLADCHRVLRIGGVLRISTPDLRKLVDEYVAGRTDEWHDVDWAPVTPCHLMNEGMRLWGHQFIYDADELTRALREAGFQHVEPVDWGSSRHEPLNGLECRPHHREVMIEATK